MSIFNNFQIIQQQILNYCKEFERDPSSVLLLPVSKRQPLTSILELAKHGITHFGENHLQEALPKIAQAKSQCNLTWHFIGSIQSNKTHEIATNFSWIHSIDRYKIAKRLNDQCPEHNAPINVCIQVNISQEASKSGVMPDAAFDLINEIRDLPNLCLRGLMCVPAPTDDYALQLKSFTKLNDLLQQLKASVADLDTLSMGMSQDFKAAIAAGATIIRIGTAIFGSRSSV